MILSIETATNICSVALHEANGTLLVCHEVHLEKSHTAALGMLVQQVLQVAGAPNGRGLSAIAVSEGPGSYTGLRLGTSTAKGLCYGWNVPLIAINTLEAMAALAVPLVAQDSLLCPMLDARRMEVYRAIFSPSLEAMDTLGLETLLPTEAHVLHNGSLLPWASEKTVYIFGNGAEKAYNLLKNTGNVQLLGQFHASAKGVGLLAAKKMASQNFEDLAYFEPFYLKEYQAKIGLAGHKLLQGL